jgi:hypothetical protein
VLAEQELPDKVLQVAALAVAAVVLVVRELTLALLGRA